MKTTLKWTDVWHAPFWYDDYGYVFDKDCVMTFTVDDLTEENEKWFKTFCDDMVKVLNGEQPSQKYPGLAVKDGCDLYQYEPILGSFRGWGHLTGTGGLNLPEEKAAAVQDELIKYVIDKLS